jgi:hypothetical protein
MMRVGKEKFVQLLPMARATAGDVLANGRLGGASTGETGLVHPVAPAAVRMTAWYGWLRRRGFGAGESC